MEMAEPLLFKERANSNLTTCPTDAPHYPAELIGICAIREVLIAALVAHSVSEFRRRLTDFVWARLEHSSSSLSRARTSTNKPKAACATDSRRSEQRSASYGALAAGCAGASRTIG